jgi:serralysin
MWRSIRLGTALALALVASPVTAIATPLTDIPFETISRSLTGGLNRQFGWTSAYDIGFTQETSSFDVLLKILLGGDDPGLALREIWEHGIESIWTDRFVIEVDSQFHYGVQFDAEFVDAGAHHNVTVHAGPGRVDMLNWFTQNPSGWPDDKQDEVAAHEAGHMFGLFDEYPAGAVDPDGSFGNVPDSLMGPLLTQTLSPRHYDFVVDWLSAKVPERSLAIVPVPETGTLFLFGSGLALLIAYARGGLERSCHRAERKLERLTRH